MKYTAKITIHRDKTIQLRKYDRMMSREEGNDKRLGIAQHKKKTPNKEIEHRSLARSRKQLIQTIQNNDEKFMSFLTLTYAENMQDIDQAFSDVRKCLRHLKYMVNKQGEELYYIGVPELQKRGAIHFHLLISIPVGHPLLPEKELKTVRSEGRLIDLKYYDFPFWNHGYSTAFPIDRQRNKDFKLSLYLIKYFYKGFENTFSGRKKILRSKNLDKPKELYLSDPEEIRGIEIDLESSMVSQYLHKQDGYSPSFVEYSYDLNEAKDSEFG